MKILFKTRAQYSVQGFIKWISQNAWPLISTVSCSILFIRESRCRQTLHYSVHDKLESGLTAQNVFCETVPVKNCCHTLSLSDIIMAALPYIKKMKEILQNPIKVRSCARQLFIRVLYLFLRSHLDFFPPTFYTFYYFAIFQIEPITLTSGVVSPPFGRARLVVVKCIAVLISLNNAAINKEIILCDIPELLLVSN